MDCPDFINKLFNESIVYNILLFHYSIKSPKKASINPLSFNLFRFKNM